ncbi:MAG TPA: membrane protein insertase YidC, partial [Thermoanaerobaculia bacterium]|nr:membrane protein insertase YidC [Thermoanaerobaculia bacterium]
ALVSFWGGKEYDRLTALPYGLEKSVRWGMFGFLARPLLWGLHWLHDHAVGNWGWAIVLMTIVLKIVLLPLTLTGYSSMQKMQRLNPKIQAIRERYRPKLRDKQGRMNPEAQRQMNEEVMALYKAEGVNPAGGCLPMLLQIPVFFAFYSVLSTSVELWHAPWIGWIHDLSAKDPLYVLPIVMGVTQFVQQKMTPAAADPMQRRMFQLFPVIFLIFSLQFPSGLVLYWLVNNLLTIAQQAIQNAVKTPAAPEPAKRGGRS